VAPFYLQFAFEAVGVANTRIFRVLRLVRVVRLFKMSRWMSSMQMFLVVISKSISSLGALLFLILLIVLVASTCVQRAIALGWFKLLTACSCAELCTSSRTHQIGMRISLTLTSRTAHRLQAFPCQCTTPSRPLHAYVPSHSCVVWLLLFILFVPFSMPASGRIRGHLPVGVDCKDIDVGPCAARISYHHDAIVGLVDPLSAGMGAVVVCTAGTEAHVSLHRCHGSGGPGK